MGWRKVFLWLNDCSSFWLNFNYLIFLNLKNTIPFHISFRDAIANKVNPNLSNYALKIKLDIHLIASIELI